MNRLRAWMDAEGLGEGPLTDVEPLVGGTQNILLRFRRQGRMFVLRHPPRHKRANSDETMRREASILAALAGSDVPHPALIAACPEVDVLGSAFYLMEAVDGFNPSLGLPDPHRSDPAMKRAMGLSMADAIAALGRVDHVAVGLGHLANPTAGSNGKSRGGSRTSWSSIRSGGVPAAKPITRVCGTWSSRSSAPSVRRARAPADNWHTRGPSHSLSAR